MASVVTMTMVSTVVAPMMTVAAEVTMTMTVANEVPVTMAVAMAMADDEKAMPMLRRGRVGHDRRRGQGRCRCNHHDRLPQHWSSPQVL